METVAILGAGTVGSAIGKNLARKKIPVVAIASRRIASARRAVREISPETEVFADPVEAAKKASIVLLTVPDREIQKLCERIARAGGFRRGTLVLHTSGFFSSRILAAAKRRGAHVGSMHPLQSFADAQTAAKLLPGSFWGWEGSAGGQGKILRLIRALEGTPLEITPSSKALYHAAAVLVSNYTASLFDAGTKLFERSRSGRRRDGLCEKALLPLLLGTVTNLSRVGLPKALTGPIARGDVAVVAGHKRAMRRGARSFLPLYLLLGRRTIPIALAKGKLRPAEARKLRRVLR